MMNLLYASVERKQSWNRWEVLCDTCAQGLQACFWQSCLILVLSWEHNPPTQICANILCLYGGSSLEPRHLNLTIASFSFNTALQASCLTELLLFAAHSCSNNNNKKKDSQTVLKSSCSAEVTEFHQKLWTTPRWYVNDQNRLTALEEGYSNIDGLYQNIIPFKKGTFDRILK